MCNVTAYTYHFSYGILYFNGENFRMGRYPDASSYVCKSLGFEVSSFNCNLEK